MRCQQTHYVSGRGDVRCPEPAVWSIGERPYPWRCDACARAHWAYHLRPSAPVPVDRDGRVPEWAPTMAVAAATALAERLRPSTAPHQLGLYGAAS